MTLNNVKHQCPLWTLVFCLTILWSISSWAETSKIRFSSVPFIGEAPSYVAYSKGYFKDEGLDITLKQNPGGWMSLKDLFEGKADIATVAELPIVYSAFDKKKYTDSERGDFYILGDMIYSQQDIQQLVARKDRGIKSPDDLKGKKIGVMRGTTLDYFMDIFFKDHRIKYSDVQIVDMNAFKLTEALAEGEVDAIFTWQPHVHRAQKRLGDNAVTMSSRAKYSTSWLIVVMKDYAEKNPKILEKFLRALVKAENFIKENTKEAIAIHSKVSKTDLDTTKVLWSIVNFDLSLDESLLTTLEGEAKWLIRKKIYDTNKVPDFMEHLYFDALEKVKPEGVQVIR